MGVKGMRNGRKGKGVAHAWLVAHVGHDGEDCLTWPFAIEGRARGRNGGRGLLGHKGEHYWAHRRMCELVNGPAPDDRPFAAHSCGNGHLGCVHPKHLSWKTQGQNLLDASAAGTHARNRFGNQGRLKPEQVQYVRDMRGVKTQLALATELDVSEGVVSGIWTGRYYNRPSRVPPWTPEEDATIQRLLQDGCTHQQIADALERRSAKSVGSRICRTGLARKRNADNDNSTISIGRRTSTRQCAGDRG